MVEPPIVVYHIAAMGNWHEVVRDQFFKLRRCGLAEALRATGDAVRITHVGEHLETIKEEAAMQDVPISIVRSDPNVSHYETFAMIEIERLAKEEKVGRPILYFHTKGVSTPHDPAKRAWRHTMEHYTLDKWRENLDILKERDAVGFNWWNFGEEHFSGTFWTATSNWIRELPSFVAFHRGRGFERYSCELWIGCAKHRRCNAYSYGCMGWRTWENTFSWSAFLPKEVRSTKRITFISIATHSYLSDLVRLQNSLKLVGPDFSLSTWTIEKSDWRNNCDKIKLLQLMLASVGTPYIFWIDADCEFLCRLMPEDLLHPDKPLTFVRHLGFSNPRTILPARLHHRLPAPAATKDMYWQTCLFGGDKQAIIDLLKRCEWGYDDERPYDEWALNVELTKMYDSVHTLPCRYAAPSSFKAMPDHHRSYMDRSGGAPRVLHHNRESNPS